MKLFDATPGERINTLESLGFRDGPVTDETRRLYDENSKLDMRLAACYYVLASCVEQTQNDAQRSTYAKELEQLSELVVKSGLRYWTGAPAAFTSLGENTDSQSLANQTVAFYDQTLNLFDGKSSSETPFKVLDVGSAGGEFEVALKSQISHVSVDNVERASHAYKQVGSAPHTVDIKDYKPENNKKYDLVHIGNIFLNVFEPGNHKFLEAIAAHVKPSGTVVVGVSAINTEMLTSDKQTVPALLSLYFSDVKLEKAWDSNNQKPIGSMSAVYICRAPKGGELSWCEPPKGAWISNGRTILPGNVDPITQRASPVQMGSVHSDNA